MGDKPSKEGTLINAVKQFSARFLSESKEYLRYIRKGDLGSEGLILEEGY